MAVPTIQSSFTVGEVAPALFGRTDLARYHAAASTFRNGFVNYRGGYNSRAGTEFVGFSKQTGRNYPPRLVPFQFSINQGLALEFGNLYMRVISDGAFVVESPITISDISRANTAVVTGTISAASATPNNGAVSTSYAPGDTVTFAGGTATTPAIVTVTNTLLKSLALNSPGTGVYAPADTILLTGGVQATPAVLSVTTTKVVSATVAAGGGSGTPGTQTVTGTTGTGTKFQASVTVSGGGAITAVLSITVAGSYTVNPTAPTVEPVTGAGLVGAQLNVKLGVATFAVFNPGVFTTNAAGGTFTQASTSGAGTAATFQTALFAPSAVTVTAAGDYSIFPANPVAQASTSGGGSGVTFNVTQSGVASLSNGDWVAVASVGGMTQVNGRTFVVHGLSGNTFQLYDVYGNAINSTSFGAYTSGGTASRVYTLVTPYSEIDLPYLKFTQSADVMSLCCVNQITGAEYQAYDLSRLADDNWELGAIVSNPTASPPTSVSAATSSAGAVTYQYVITSVNADDGTESIASPIAQIASAVNIAATAGTITVSWSPVPSIPRYNIYKATPGVSTTPPVGSIFGYAGFALGNSFIDSNIVADFAQVPPTHQDPFARGQAISITMSATGSAYTAATTVSISSATGTGFVGRPIIGNSISGQRLTFASNPFLTGQTVAQNIHHGTPNAGVVVAATATTIDVTVTQGSGFITTSPVTNEFEATAFPTAVANITLSGSSGIVGVIIDDAGRNYLPADQAVFTDSGGGSGAVGVLSVGPIGGTYPGVVAYFQERRAYAYTLNNPDTYFMSQPGAFTNFDSRIPTIASDAIIGTPWSTEVNGIQFMVSMPGGLVVLTGLQAWQLTGTGGSSLNPEPITPSTQQAQPQAYNGCSATVPPIRIDYDILYVQAKGSIVRGLAYQFYTNIYTGTDLTLNSSHLFTGFTIKEWAWCEEPYKLLWAVRNDGTMLCLTFLKPEQVAGWGRSDTQGLFQSVCSVTEPPVDALYMAVQRFPGSNTCYTIERMDNRLWESVEDVWCVDCGLQLSQPAPSATLTASSARGAGTCTGVTGLVGGQSYSSSTTATVVDANGLGPGTGAVPVLTIAGGVITAVAFSPGGSNYISPVLVINDPSGQGTGASATLTLSNAATFAASAAIFSAGDVGDVIRMGGGTATITAYTDTTHVVAQITQPIVEILPNSVTAANPGGTPLPQVSGDWTLTTPVSSVTGLWHLVGATVTGLADGVVIAPTVVPSTGTIPLPQASTAVVVGLGFQAQLQSIYLDVGEPTVQGARKKVAAVTARIEASRGLTVGTNQPDGSTQSPAQLAPTWSGLTTVPDKGVPPYNSAVIPLYTGDVFIPVAGGFQTPGQVCLQQDNPLPMNILAIIDDFWAGDTPQARDPQQENRGRR